MPDSSSLVELIKLGREERFLEYKDSVSWDTIKPKIAKTAMGMSNIRDGGTIIIGMSKKGSSYKAKGNQKQILKTYDEDKIHAFINNYADPYVRLELHSIEWNMKTFLVMVVHEFEEFPVVCKKSNGNVLRQGATYARSYRIPETREVQSETEMREIIEMATEKGIRRFMELTQRLGIPVEGAEKEADAERFKKQLEGI